MSTIGEHERLWVANDDGDYKAIEAVTPEKERAYKIQVWDDTLRVWSDVPDQLVRE